MLIEFLLQWKCLLFAVFLHKSYIWEKSCSWDVGKMLSANQIAWFLNELFFSIANWENQVSGPKSSLYL